MNMNMNDNFIEIFEKIYPTKEKIKKKHAGCFPQNIFMIISGSTGSGKTNLLINILLKGLLHYSDIYIWAPTSHQKLYKYLRKHFEDLEEQSKTKYLLDRKLAYFFNEGDEIPDPSALKSDESHVMVFDDVMNENQTKITDYFCRGRHNNLNVFYLCQSLHKLKKHGIRENANIFILFKQDTKTLKYFHETHIIGDMDYKEFEQFCFNSWKKNHGYVVINLWSEPKKHKYVSNYEQLYIPKKFTTAV